MVEEVVNLYELEKKLERSIKEDDKNIEYKQDEFRVSELPYCHRKTFIFRKYNLKQEINGRMLSGTMFHSYLNKFISKIEDFKDAKFEVPCEDNLGDIKIKGSADIVVGDTVYEFKYSASKLNKSDLPLYYIEQSNSYANMLKLNGFVLSFINSFTLKPTLMKFPADKELYEKTKTEAKKLYDCIKTDTFPDGPKWEWECKYCPVRDKCKELKELQKFEKAFDGKEIVNYA